MEDCLELWEKSLINLPMSEVALPVIFKCVDLYSKSSVVCVYI